MALVSKMQVSFAGGELAPALHARADLAKYATGLKTARNVFIHAHGGASNRPGTRFVCRIKNSAKAARLAPFQFSTVQAYVLALGDLTMRVIKDGAQVLETGKTITAATQANPVMITAVAHGFSNGDEVYVSSVVGMTAVNGRNFKVANKTTDTFEIADLGGTGIDGTAFGAYASGGTAARVYTLTTPYVAEDLARLTYVQSADVMYPTHVGYEPRKLSRTGHTAWTITAMTFAPGIAAPTGATAAPTGSGAITYQYQVTAIATDTAEESLPSSTASCSNDLNVSPNKNTISWSAVTGAERYNVYGYSGGIFGYIGSTNAASLVDDNITPDTASTPPGSRNPFSGAGNYPGAVSFYEQRLVYAGSTNRPQTIWTSGSANYANFNVSQPAKDNDAVTFTIASRQVNEVRALVPLGEMLVFTSGGEWKAGGAGGEPLTPSNIVVKPQSYRGSARVSPLVIGNAVLHVQQMGAVVRDLGYKLDVDGYVGNDLSVLSAHLFEGRTVVDWAYAQSPHSIVWAVRDDGALLSLTYMREHEVWGWCRHETDGLYESVASIPESGEDVVYFVVRRTIDGETVRYIERLESRIVSDVTDAFFVDCGLTYDGAPATTITGLEHLEGRDVVALADGNVVRDLTVSGGAVTLSRQHSTVHVGLAYTSSIQTLAVDFGPQVNGGAAAGKQKKVAGLSIMVEKTRGIWAGPDDTRMTEYKQRATEAWGAPISLKTGVISMAITASWVRDSAGSVVIEQRDPLPMTILAVVPEVAFG